MTPEELKWLYETARKVPAGELIVEIGAWRGRSSVAIYLGAGEKNPVVSVDTWKGSPDEPEHEVAKTEDIFSDYLSNVELIGVKPRKFESFGSMGKGVYYLVGDSLEVVNDFPDKSICWLFYDGRHTKTGENLDAWIAKMKPDGLLTGHDYFCFFEHIQQEIHQRFYIHQLHQSIWVKYMEHAKPPRWL